MTDSTSGIRALAERVRLTRRMPSPETARAIRRTAGVSQETLATAVGVSRQAIAYYETGRRRPRGTRLEAYAAALEALKAASDG